MSPLGAFAGARGYNHSFEVFMVNSVDVSSGSSPSEVSWAVHDPCGNAVLSGGAGFVTRPCPTLICPALADVLATPGDEPAREEALRTLRMPWRLPLEHQLTHEVARILLEQVLGYDVDYVDRSGEVQADTWAEDIVEQDLGGCTGGGALRETQKNLEKPIKNVENLRKSKEKQIKRI